MKSVMHSHSDKIEIVINADEITEERFESLL